MRRVIPIAPWAMLAVVTLAWAAAADDASPAFKDSPQEFGLIFVRPVNPGTQGRLQARAGDKVFVSFEQDVISERDKTYGEAGAFPADDAEGIAARVKKKEGLLLPNGTKFQTLSSYMNPVKDAFSTYRQVKIMGGPAQGKSVWVSGAESFGFDVQALKAGDEAMLGKGRSVPLRPGVVVVGEIPEFNALVRAIRDGGPKAEWDRALKAASVWRNEAGTRVKVQVVACSPDRIAHFGLAGAAVRVEIGDGPNQGKVGWAIPEAVVRATAGDPLEPGAKPDSSPGWRSIRSDKGGFTVEFPGPPTVVEHRTVDGAPVEILGSRTKELETIVMTVVHPAEVSRKEAVRIQRTYRDKAATRFGRSVTSQYAREMDPIGAIQTVEFGYRSDGANDQSADVIGDSYIDGRKFYFVFVRYRPVPGGYSHDLVRYRSSFAVRGVPPEAGSTPTAADPSGPGPVPAAEDSKPHATPIAAKWKQVDPDRDVKVDGSDRLMTLRVPATPHVLAPERGVMNAPRVVAPVTGDFTVTVRVVGKFQPTRPTTVKGLSPRQAGGLLLWKDERNYLVHQLRVVAGESKAQAEVVLEGQTGGDKAASHRQPLDDAPLFLRIERRGTRIAAGYTSDPKAWKELEPVVAEWAAGPVQVGVVALNTSPTPLVIRFEDLAIQGP